jgi:hypothetical protein
MGRLHTAINICQIRAVWNTHSQMGTIIKKFIKPSADVDPVN